jgi:hypothetical protein
MKSIELYRLAMGTFGKDAPRYTIGVSRREERPPPPTPGPGQYTPPCDAFASSRMKHRFPGAVPSSNSNYIDVDYLDTDRFPESHQSYIGNKFGKGFFLPIETPSPAYLPPSSLSPISHKITSRTPIRLAPDSPGPGQYTPRLASLPRAPAYSVSGIPSRDQWLQNKEGVPGPPDYNPVPAKVMPKPPEWTVGKRSRLSKKRRHPSPPKLRYLPLGWFVIPLESTNDVQEARTYLLAHPDIKQFIEWITDEIFGLKPDDPVEVFEDGGRRFWNDPVYE